MVEQRDLAIIFSNPIEWESFRNKTVLVTGASGRLGIYIVAALNKADIDFNLNLRIIALARNEQKLRGLLGRSVQLPNLQLLIQDITQPVNWAGEVDYIFHTAGLASPKDFTEIPVDTLWGHLQGTRNVLELARAKGAKVVYVSTVETYGTWNSEQGIKEEDCGPLRCDNARACYPEAKRMCETMLAAYEAQYGVPYVGVRFCHTFGPGIALDDGRAFAEFISCALAGKDIVLHSDGSAARTYTYVADAIGALLLVATKGTEHYYNVANLQNLITIRDLARLIASLAPQQKTQVKFDAAAGTGLKYLPFKLGIMNVDRVLALGWRPQVGTDDAFRYTMAYYQQRQQG